MHHYVYRLLNNSTNEYYYGSRSSKLDPNLDTYMGSMKTWKPNKKELTKEIICTFETRLLANVFETNIIKQHINDPLNKNYSIPGPSFSYYGIKGITRSEDHKKALSWKGRTHSEETKKKMSESAKGKKKKTPKPGRSVAQVNDDGIIIAKYNSLILASKATGAGTGNICTAIKNKRKSAGYHWLYIESQK